MSFLAPWFVLAGLAAVALPVLFHLFRRTPRGKMPFSTLMFLTPSPPRLTSRNRLENWPLLLLRAAILALLAVAFGRPFLRQMLEDHTPAPLGKRVVLVIDTSASMQRADLWSQAKRAAEQQITQLSPHDELAIFAFDDAPQSHVTFETWRTAPVSERVGLARAAVADLKPTWYATRLDQALLAAVEALEATECEGATKTADREQHIVLISDLQAGSQLTALQSFEWPQRVTVELVPLTTSGANAGVHPLIATKDATSANASAQRMKVLVTNSPHATHENFQLSWKTDQAEFAKPLPIYVPPGQTRVVTTPAMPPGPIAELLLTGDADPFDNSLWFVPPTREQVRVLHLSKEPAEDPQTLRYFLERALSLPSASRVVTVDSLDPHAENVRAPSVSDLENVPLIVLAVENELPETWRNALAPWLEQGGVLLSVIANTNSRAWQSFVPPDAAEGITIEEHDAAREYALFSQIDLRHPWFEPLNDPRFSDFTKIRCWGHRRLTLNEAARAAFHSVAQFDSGYPAILESRAGKGRVLLLTTGWQPRESQLGVSSKFVPLMTTLLELGCRRPPPTASFFAGELVNLSHLGTAVEETDDAKTTPLSVGPWKITTPAGETITVQTDTPQILPAAGPGVYVVESAAGVQRIAVNVPAEESKTDPLAPESLEALGVRLWKPTSELSPTQLAEKQLLQVRELESRQQIWRWVLVLALLTVIGETWYAGKVARLHPASV